jgi:hypothetical protein
MVTLILLLAPPLIGLAIVIIMAIWATNTLAHRTIGQKHLLMNEILTTGNVPDSWSKRFVPKLAELKGSPANAERLRRVQTEARQDYIRRLDQLIKYIRTTHLVADEETREEVLAQLQSIRSDWLSQPNESS